MLLTDNPFLLSIRKIVNNVPKHVKEYFTKELAWFYDVWKQEISRKRIET